jgi:Fe/S biogenesis protein NfuA
MREEPLLDITPTALEQLLRFRAEAERPEERCLYVRVAGVAEREYSYALSIEPRSIAQPDDVHQRVGELAVVVVGGAGAERLRGASIDWVDEPARAGFRVDNPNRPPLDEDLADRVRLALEESVNPGIALHGGRADLVAVEGRTAYVRLSGGCQGCGMAAATLGQLIEATLTEAVPEIADVVDVTEHAAGTNPYYAPAPAA